MRTRNKIKLMRFLYYRLQILMIYLVNFHSKGKVLHFPDSQPSWKKVSAVKQSISISFLFGCSSSTHTLNYYYVTVSTFDTFFSLRDFSNLISATYLIQFSLLKVLYDDEGEHLCVTFTFILSILELHLSQYCRKNNFQVP